MNTNERGEMEATAKEQAWFDRLKRCYDEMPDSVWIFTANGTVNMLRLGGDGRRAMDGGGSVDQDFLLDGFVARTDGGDW